MSVAEHLAGARVCICAGSGGVGKTSTAAAIALGLAIEGRRVALVTIDPARRLADALGIEHLGDEPHRVALDAPGELWAMMLDPRRTLDDLVTRLAPDASARDDILGNRIYRELSGAVAGSQEFSAIAKLYDLDRSARFDIIVLDTPPSRNALDFLDAPDRLTGFLDGRALRVFLAGGGGLAARIAARGTGVVFSVLERVTGVALLDDLGVFLRALGGVLDGFRERSVAVKKMLRDPSTTFLVVTSPQREAVEEAIFFAAKLAEAGMPFGGLVVNRVHPLAGEDEAGPPLDVEPALARKLERALADLQALARRDAQALARLRRETGDQSPVLVPQLDGDVHDLDGLHALRGWLFAPAADRAAMLAARGY